MVALIILSIVGFILCGVLTIMWVAKKNRRKETSDWQVGDLIIVNGEDDLIKLLGWSEEGFYIEGDNGVHKLEWVRFKYNKSAIWRRNHKSCEDYMNGAKPGFTPALNNEVSQSSTIDGKPIDLLSEVECQIYLKKALESENYELAEAIKKQMEKYR
jgi:hypothetical protein